MHHCQHIWALVIRCVQRIDASNLALPSVTSYALTHLGTLSWGPTRTYYWQTSLPPNSIQPRRSPRLCARTSPLPPTPALCWSIHLYTQPHFYADDTQMSWSIVWTTKKRMSTRVLITRCLDYRSRILPLGFPNIWRRHSQCPRPKPLESSTCRHLHFLHLRHI